MQMHLCAYIHSDVWQWNWLRQLLLLCLILNRLLLVPIADAHSFKMQVHLTPQQLLVYATLIRMFVLVFMDRFLSIGERFGSASPKSIVKLCPEQCVLARRGL